jgi:PAS domain S-box-containing protein
MLWCITMAVEKFPDEISAIRAILSEHPEGLTIRSISALLGMNRNSVAKYLEMLQMQGGLTLKRSGPSKIYCLADKLPAAAVLKLTKSHVIIFDQLLTAADVNDSFTGLLKISKKEILGKSLEDLPFIVQSHPDLQTLIKEGIRGKESKTSASIKTDYRLIHCMLTCSPVFFENGSNGVSLIIDLDQEPKNGDVPDNNGDDSLTGLDESEYICRFEPDGTLTYVNQAYSVLLKKTRADLIGHKWRPVIPESEYQKITTALHSTNSAHPVTTAEIKVITPMGNSQYQRWKFRILLDSYGKSTGYQATGLDITELKKLEQKITKNTDEIDNLLQEHKVEIQDLNKQIFKEIASHEKTHFQLQFTEFAMDNASYMITWIGREGRFVYMNREAQRVLGYHYHDVISKKFIDIVAGVFSFPWDEIWETIKTDQHYTLEIVLVTSKGIEIPVEMVLNYLKFKDKEYCCCFAKDITEKKKSENALKESEQKYRDIFEKSLLGLFKSTPDGKLIDANDAFARMYGYSNAAEILAANLDISRQLYADPKDRKELLRILAENGTIENYETPHLKRDGTRFWISINARTIRNMDGDVVVYDGSYVDISERKLAETALKESEHKYRTLVENIPEKIFIKDTSLAYVSCNEHYARDLGIGVDAIAGKTDFDFYSHDLAEKYRADDRSVMESRAPKRVEELYVVNGRELWVSTSKTPIWDDKGNITGILGTFHDFTAYKQVKDALRQQSEIVQNMAEGVVLIRESDGTIVYANPRFETMFGYDPTELIGKHVSTINATGVKSSQTIADEIISNLRQTGQWNGELLNIRKDGTTFWCHATVSTFDSPQYGKVWISVHMDISRRKLAEEALRNREHDFSTLVENATDMIVRYDSHLRYIYCNPAVERLLGIPFHQLLGKTTLDFGSSVKQSRFIDASLRKTLATGIEQEVEQPIPTLSGLRYFSTRIVPERDDDGNIISLLAISRDITDRKRAEEALQKKSRSDLKTSSDNLQRSETDLQIHQTELEVQNEELRRTQRDLEVSHGRYFELYDLAPAGYITLSKDGLILNANLTVADLLGVERSSLIEKPVSQFLVKEDQDIFYRCRKELIKTGERHLCELHMLRRGGLPVRVQIVIAPAPSVEGKEAALSLMLIDITGRKQTGGALQNSEKHFGEMFESHASVMLLIDPETGKIIEVNRAAEWFYGRSRENLCTLSIDEINTLPSDEIKTLRAKVARGQITSFTAQHRCSSGEIKDVEVHSSPIAMGEKTVLFSIIHDITDREKDRKDTKKSPVNEHGLR